MDTYLVTGGIMADSWLSPSVLVSAWSAIAATIASVIAWRVYRAQRLADMPVVGCEYDPIRGLDDWLVLTITVRNFSATRWRCESLKVRRPKDARGLSRWKLPEFDSYDHSFNLALAKDHASNPIALTSVVDASGTPRDSAWGIGDVKYETIYLLRESVRSKKLSMRLTLVSMDAIERRMTITINRQLPADPNTATD